MPEDMQRPSYVYDLSRHGNPKAVLRPHKSPRSSFPPDCTAEMPTIPTSHGNLSSFFPSPGQCHWDEQRRGARTLTKEPLPSATPISGRQYPVFLHLLPRQSTNLIVSWTTQVSNLTFLPVWCDAPGTWGHLAQPRRISLQPAFLFFYFNFFFFFLFFFFRRLFFPLPALLVHS